MPINRFIDPKTFKDSNTIALDGKHNTSNQYFMLKAAKTAARKKKDAERAKAKRAEHKLLSTTSLRDLIYYQF